MPLCQVSNSPPGLGFSPPAIVPTITGLGSRSLLRRVTPPAKKSRRSRMVVAMVSRKACHFESLRVREGGMVSTKSALEVNDSQQDWVVSRSKLD